MATESIADKVIGRVWCYGVFGPVWVGMYTYMGVRGIFDEQFREQVINGMVGDAMCRGYKSKVDDLMLRIWGQDIRKDARKKIRQGMIWHNVRDRRFGLMSDEQMATYVGGVVQNFLANLPDSRTPAINKYNKMLQKGVN